MEIKRIFVLFGRAEVSIGNILLYRINQWYEPQGKPQTMYAESCGGNQTQASLSGDLSGEVESEDGFNFHVVRVIILYIHCMPAEKDEI